MAKKHATHDEYLENLPKEFRLALEKLRKAIRAAAPKAEECMSYGVCAFRQEGMLVGYGATAKHCSFFLMSNTTVDAHEELLADYDTSKGTIRFSPAKPLPVTLVKKLVKARLAEKGL